MTETSNANELTAGVLMADGASDVHTNINPTDTEVATDAEVKPETLQQGSAPAVRETNKATLERLARQVEYYFSTANLEKDTYVATLRSLNDGYVPVSIIANFGKVKALVPTDSVNSVRRAAIDYSELLEVVHIDTETGKRVDDETVATSPEVLTVEAVGPKSGEPIPMSSITSSTPISPTAIKTVTSNSQVQNTLIIREVPEGVEESHIRDLFTFEKCPPIQSMHLDVANCWFVTMDTTSKDDMIHVMFELRSKKFPSGESVKARLKSAVVVTSDFSPSNIRFTRTDGPMAFAPQIQGGSKKMGQGNNGKKRKNNANKNKNNASSQNKTSKGGKNSSAAGGNGGQRRNNNLPTNGQKQNNRKQGGKQDDRTRAVQQAPPSLGEDHFPSLCNDEIVNKNKIEVEKLPDQRPEDEMDKARTSSDSASTATTTSSSSSSKNPQSSQQQLVGGYAAALLKAAPPMPPKPAVEQKEESSRQVSAVEKKDGKKSNNEQKVSAASKEKAPVVRKDGGKKNMNKKVAESKATPAAATLSVQPPSWGGGRSFADVLRKEGAAAALEAAPQRAS